VCVWNIIKERESERERNDGIFEIKIFLMYTLFRCMMRHERSVYVAGVEREKGRKMKKIEFTLRITKLFLS
jgi:hypothetical protein